MIIFLAFGACLAPSLASFLSLSSIVGLPVPLSTTVSTFFLLLLRFQLLVGGSADAVDLGMLMDICCLLNASTSATAQRNDKTWNDLYLGSISYG